MTSSFRATGHASVRQTPADKVTSATAWALEELPAPNAPKTPPTAAPAQDPELLAAERARLIDEGYARGLADGEKKAAAAAQQKVNGALAVIGQITAQLNEIASCAPAVLEENVAALAVIVARQIVSREVSLDRELVADLVRRALTEFPIDQSVRIRVNPLDLSMLSLGSPTGNGNDMAPISGARDVTWQADPRIARGGALVEGRDRIIDGRVDTALERAYRHMADLDAS